MSRSRFLRLLTLISILILLNPACTRQSSIGDQAIDLNVQLTFEPDPPVVGEGVIRIRVTDSRGQAIDGLSIQVKGDMTHAGMTPVFGISTPEGDGSYSVPFEWTMAGDWVLQLIAELQDGTVLNRSFEVRVVSE